MKKEVEVFGVNYERYATGNLLQKLKNKLCLQSVAELPAYGTKAMPSIYSVGFAKAGATVTLVDGNIAYRDQWEKLGLLDRVRFLKVDNIYHTGLADNSFDFVWNFAYIPTAQDPASLAAEMKRISKKYIAVFSVNGRNVGYYVHSMLHKITGIPWTHGDKKFNYTKNVVNLFQHCGLKVIQKGYVDTPLWPDSLGFRDMRLHRNHITFDNAAWESPYIEMLRTGNFPFWMKAMYAWEKMPMITFIKTLYSHIFYVIGEKVDP